MIHETTTASPCLVVTADLLTSDTHTCDAEGPHGEHACACGTTWPPEPGTDDTLEPKEG